MRKTAKRTKCLHSGCRKLQVPGEKFCQLHLGSNGIGDSEPTIDTVVKMTDVERLTLVKVETECVNFILQLRNHDLETEEVKRKFTEQLHSRAAHREQLMALAESKKDEQQRTVKEIAARYQLEPDQMVYDPDSGVLRDLRQQDRT